MLHKSLIPSANDGVQIVEKSSALLDVEHEEQIPVDANHSLICKYEKEEDSAFEQVYKRIRRMRKRLQSGATDKASMSGC